MFNSCDRLLNPSLFHKKETEGFTTLEVLVGVLITVVFFAVTAQTIALAAAIRVRAQESSDAANWVQDDRKVIETQALELGGYDSVTGTYADMSGCDANGGAGFAALLQAQPDDHPEVASADATIGTLDTDPKVSPIGDRDYTLQRTTSIDPGTPNILRVDYQVFRGTTATGDPIFQYRAEVIPGVVFACRQI